MSETGGARDGISRRDFLDGVAISAAGLAAAAASPYLTGAEAALAAAGHGHGPQPPVLPPGYYPPTSTGITGEPDRVIDMIYKIDGRPNVKAAARHSARGGPGVHVPVVGDCGDEPYDCVVVGAGASGLAAAKFYQDRFGPDARILLLDPLPDFGGHSHRNEFHVPNAAAGGADVTILRNGGTVNLDSIGAWNQPAGSLLDIPGSYGQPALDMLSFCGVTPDAFPSSAAPGIPASYGLRQMLLFPAKDWGREALVQNRVGATETGVAGWTAFLSRTPFSQAARDAIVRIQTDETTDWIAARHGPMSVDEKVQLLTRITYKQYLKEYVGAPEEAIVQYQRSSHGLLGAGAQAVSAADCWMLGQPGFEGLGLGDVEGRTFPGIGRTPQMDNMVGSEPSVAWPDGNTSLLRLLVSKLIPNAIADVDGARPTQENIVKAACDYTQLDRPGNAVRIRLNSLVTEVKPARRGDRYAELVYTPLGGRGRHVGFKVRASHVVMACWNRVTAHLVDGLPRHQVEDLCYARKVPLIYGRAVLNNWQAWADAKISSVSPRGKSLFWDSTSLSAGAAFGSAYGPTPHELPTEPASLSFTVVPNDPRQTPQIAAYESGRVQLLNMSFADLEGALVDVIDRSVNRSGGDFEPERDMHAIMINRWNYGYAHELTSVWDPSVYGPVADQPQVRGRVPFRNVSIANSDSGAMAYTHSAISEGYRAVQDLPDAPPPHRPRHRRHRHGAAHAH